MEKTNANHSQENQLFSQRTTLSPNESTLLPQTSFSLSATGIMFGIPLEISIVHNHSCSILSGKFSFSEDYLIKLLNGIYQNFGDAFCKVPFYQYIKNLAGDVALAWQSNGLFAAAYCNDVLSFGVMHEKKGTVLIVSSENDTLCCTKENDDFANFVQLLKETAGAFNLRFAFKNGDLALSQGNTLLQKLEKIAFDKESPSVFLSDNTALKDISVLVLASANLSDSNMGFLNVLSKILPEGTTISLSAGFGKTFFILLHMDSSHAKIDKNKLDIRELDCSFIYSTSITLSLKGTLAFYIDGHEHLFIISSLASANEFSLAASYSSTINPLTIGSFFKLFELGISFGYSNGGLIFGGWGSVTLGNLDLFALLFMKCTGNVLSLTALGLAINQMSFTQLLSAFNITLPGGKDFEIFSIEPLPIKAKIMDITPLKNIKNTKNNTDIYKNVELINTNSFIENTDTYNDIDKDTLKKIANAFCAACDGSCGGRTASAVTFDKILVRKTKQGWMLTDQNNIRHYTISSKGEIALAPQLYYCTQNSIAAGNYTLYKGLFVCASLVLLGVKINLFLEVNKDGGMETLVNISPINLGWLVLDRAVKQQSMRSMETLENKDNNLLDQYLYDGSGPTLYLCLKKNDYVLYLNASLKLLNICEISTFLSYESGKFYLDASIAFFTLKAHLTLIANYSDFNSGQFYFSISVDLSFFQNIANKVVDMVKAFVAKTQQKLTTAQQQLDYAQQKVLGLQSQIANVDRQIARYNQELHNLRWWQFYKAPYLLIVIGGLELEKAGIYIAIGAAYAALEIAKQVLELVKQATGAIGWLIQQLVKSISSIFYLKSISLTINAQQAKKMQIEMAACFTLFGKDYNANSQISLGGNVKNELHNSASDKITTKAQNEMDKMKNDHLILQNAQCSIKDFLMESDFPYSDCEGYTKCLKDGLDFSDKSAITAGYLETMYQNDFDAKDPLSERHDGQMYRKLHQVKSQWQGLFSLVQELDCSELIQEAKKQLIEQNIQLTQQELLSFDEIDKKWQSLQGLQSAINEESDRISQIDSRFVDIKEQTQQVLVHRFNMDFPYISDVSPQECADQYYAHLFTFFASSINDTYSKKYDTILPNALPFFMDDSENYFVNPANEPIIDKLFAEVCSNSSEIEMQKLKNAALQDMEAKKSLKNYHTRIEI